MPLVVVFPARRAFLVVGRTCGGRRHDANPIKRAVQVRTAALGSAREASSGESATRAMMHHVDVKILEDEHARNFGRWDH
jgi:hypothetical protein